MQEPYSRFDSDELIVRDYLAADRTVLANERTLLSYVRTALAFAISGASLVHFFISLVADITGWALLLLSVTTLGMGIRRYVSTKRRVDRILDKETVGIDRVAP